MVRLRVGERMTTKPNSGQMLTTIIWGHKTTTWCRGFQETERDIIVLTFFLDFHIKGSYWHNVSVGHFIPRLTKSLWIRARTPQIAVLAGLPVQSKKLGPVNTLRIWRWTGPNAYVHNPSPSIALTREGKVCKIYGQERFDHVFA